MTDRKFTGDEVIKALRELQEMSEFTPPICHYEKDITEPPFCKPFEQFQNDVKVALALINRQKAEIERLNAVHADMTESLRLAAEANKDMQAEIEAKEEEYADLLGQRNAVEMMLDSSRAEAIKEFAWRLKNRLTPYPEAPFCEMVGSLDIDALVEEMTEDNNESQNT